MSAVVVHHVADLPGNNTNTTFANFAFGLVIASRVVIVIVSRWEPGGLAGEKNLSGPGKQPKIVTDRRYVSMGS